MSNLEKAIEDFLKYGKPCEGSFGYHDAWKKLKTEYELQKENKQKEI